jgi:hypothetical protein
MTESFFLLSSFCRLSRSRWRGPCAKLRWKSQNTKSSRLWGQPFTLVNILDMLEAAITGPPSEAALRSYEKQARCEIPLQLSASTRREIKAEFRSPSVQLGELPGLRPRDISPMPLAPFRHRSRIRAGDRVRAERRGIR